MLRRYSEKAMLAKVRARFGKRLTEKNYEELCSLSSVSGVASYLKKHPHYKDTLVTVDPRNVHRGQLEAVLRRGIFSQYAGLAGSQPGGENGFYNYVILRSEVDQIVTMLRLIQAGTPGNYLLILPNYLIKYASFNLEALGRATSFDELLEVLRQTQYYQILRRNRPAGSKKIDIAACERALITQYYNAVLELISKHFDTNEQEQLRKMLMLHVDIQNLTYVYRLKRFFDAPPEQILGALLPFDTPSKRVIEIMTTAKTPKELTDALRASRYHWDKKINPDNPDYIEALTGRREYDLALHNIHFSSSPAVVLMSYMTHLEQEIDNITNIIEGIRYELSREEIQHMLIL